jgi:hypothetical protein
MLRCSIDRHIMVIQSLHVNKYFALHYKVA